MFRLKCRETPRLLRGDKGVAQRSDPDQKYGVLGKYVTFVNTEQ